MLRLYLLPGTINLFTQKHFSNVQKAKLLMIIGFFLHRFEQAVIGTHSFPASSQRCSCGTCATEFDYRDIFILSRKKFSLPEGYEAQRSTRQNMTTDFISTEQNEQIDLLMALRF